MGSKNPAVITSKADLEKAAEGVVRGAFGYSGQKCSATSRVYVERGIKNDFLKILKDKVDQLKVGDPRDKDAFVGPVINEKSVKKYQRYLELAKKDGGKIVAGGGLPEDKKLSKGYYVKPTVVTGLPSNDRLLKEELFLPFIVVDEVKSLDEALKKANDTDFGLTAGIFSNDLSEVDTFFKNIDFGVTYANRKGGATQAPGQALNRLAAGREVERRAKELEDHTICWSSCTNKPRRSSKTPRNHSIYFVKEHFFFSYWKHARGCNGVSIAETTHLRAGLRKDLRERGFLSLLNKARKDLRSSS
jgi:acyl-CoA reductase-like NAD-dependent aldehyde dehydrogenase